MSNSDIVELNQLAYRYAAAVDACDVEDFLAVFTPEGRLRSYHPDEEEPFADLAGHAQLATIPNTMRGMHRRTTHMMTNHLVEVEGDAATGVVLCTARHLSTDAGHTMNVIIRYIDRYERRGGAWKIADRQIRFLWSERHEVTDSGMGRR
jgi:3-phenylpropionate/cinnamic acid dioxygenase small subunit